MQERGKKSKQRPAGKSRRTILKLLSVLLGMALGLGAGEIIARLDGAYARHLSAVAEAEKPWANRPGTADDVQSRRHAAMGFLRAASRLAEVVAVVRQSETPDAAIERLVEEFSLTEVQAQSVLETSLGGYTRIERERVGQELRELMAMAGGSAATDPEPQRSGSEHAVRILVLGDSFSVESRFIRRDQTWPAILERLLTERFGMDEKTFLVHNVAKGGADLRTHFQLVADELKVAEGRYELILQQLLINDFSIDAYRDINGIPPRSEPLAVSKDSRFHLRFYLERFLSGRLTGSYGSWIKRFENTDLPHWEVVANDYRRIADLAADHDAHLVTFLVPMLVWRKPLFGSDSEYALRDFHESIRSTLEPLAPSYLDLLPALQERVDSGYDHWVSPDLPDGHPDAYIHGLYAEFLLEHLESSGVLDEIME